MIGMADDFKCGSTDAACLCKNANFEFGVRDCANESCGSKDDAEKVIAYGKEYCKKAGAGSGGGSVSRPGCEYVFFPFRELTFRQERYRI